MAKLKIFQCKSCTAPLPAGTTKCASCGHINSIQSEAEVNPLKMSSEMAQKYIDFFKQKTTENPKDTNSLFAMGLFYLGLKNYELAQRNFKLAVDISPMDSDMYYYYALSLFSGRSPRVLNHQEAERIYTYINSAIQMHNKRKYQILKMVLTQGFFEAQGLKYDGKTPDELFSEIKVTVPELDDVEEIETYLNVVDDKNITYLKAIKEGFDVLPSEKKFRPNIGNVADYLVCPSCGEEHTIQLKNNGEYQCSNCSYCISAESVKKFPENYVCFYPSIRDEDFVVDEITDVRALTSASMRNDFFDYLYEPELPEKINKPWFPILPRFLKLILSLVIVFVFFLIEGFVGFSFDEKKITPSQTIKEQYADLYQNKKMKRSEREEIMQQFTNDSIAKAQSDSVWYADYTIIAYNKVVDGKTEIIFSSEPSAEELPLVTAYTGMVTSWHLPVTILFILSPFLIWLIITIVKFSKNSKERREINEINKNNISFYDFSQKKFEERQTIWGFINYVKHFLAENDKLVPNGDPVFRALREQGISEEERAGKTFFVNYFDYTDANENDSTHPSDVLSRVYYSIAFLAKDCVMLFFNYWDTRNTELARCDYKLIPYDKINGLERTDDQIIIDKANDVVINLPPDKRPSIYFASSNARTSDPDEFFKALNRLVRSHQNR